MRWEGHRHALIPDLQKDFRRRRSLEAVWSNGKLRSSSTDLTQPSSDYSEPGSRLPSNPWQSGCRQGGTASCAPPSLPHPHRDGSAPSPTTAHATAAQGADSCAGKWKPAPSRQRSCRMLQPMLCPQQPTRWGGSQDPHSMLGTWYSFSKRSHLPFKPFPFPPSLLHPALPSITAPAPSSTCAVPALGSQPTRAFVLTTGFALPAIFPVIF